MDDEAKKAIEDADAKKAEYQEKIDKIADEIASKKQEAAEEAAAERKQIIEHARLEGDSI